MLPNIRNKDVVMESSVPEVEEGNRQAPIELTSSKCSPISKITAKSNDTRTTRSRTRQDNGVEIPKVVYCENNTDELGTYDASSQAAESSIVFMESKSMGGSSNTSSV